MKKALKKISVQTLPNGYALDFDGSQFMYYNDIDLLAGFMARVGSGKTEDMEKGDILNALFDVMLGEKYAKDVTRLNNIVEKLQVKYSDSLIKLQKEIVIIKDAIENHDKMMKVLTETTKMLNEMRMAYQDAYKPYDEFNQRINKLECDTVRIESHFGLATAEADMKLKMIETKLRDVTKAERLLTARADTLIGRLSERLRDGKPVSEKDEEDNNPFRNESIIEQPSQTSKKKSTPRKKPDKQTKPKGKTTRQKRDEAILKKMEENPNIK